MCFHLMPPSGPSMKWIMPIFNSNKFPVICHQYIKYQKKIFRHSQVRAFMSPELTDDGQTDTVGDNSTPRLAVGQGVTIGQCTRLYILHPLKRSRSEKFISSSPSLGFLIIPTNNNNGIHAVSATQVIL